MDNLTPFDDLRCRDARRFGIYGRSAASSADAAPESADAYEPPQIIVIGNVRDITAGSASSGRRDANSQYYW